MIAENRECLSEDLGNDPDENRSGSLACRAFLALNDWQIRRYRTAIDENKWFMGERFGREVTWAEAEQDFLNHGYYGCAEIWRSEYCQAICSHSQNCLLGQRFTRES